MTEIDSEYWKKEYQRDLDLKAKQICEDGAKIERLTDERDSANARVQRLREALDNIYEHNFPPFIGEKWQVETREVAKHALSETEEQKT